MTQKTQQHKMWGGRFKDGPDALMEQINESVSFDKRLYPQDIHASKAHADMLIKQGIISEKDGKHILDGLDRIKEEMDEDQFVFQTSLEDIHMNIESALIEKIGSAGGRLHTARSRNDQVATDFRLFVRDSLDLLDEELSALQHAFIMQAEKHVDTIMPGFTHLQTAQPVTFGHHMMAYVEMISRDRSRVADARKRMNECPLGAAALAGTSFPIDRHKTAKALGFDRPTANSLDSVSDRDFALEFLSIASICAVHLSRLAEELVIWCSAGFQFVSLSDKFTTGSSIMPQKRNPDAAELVRGKTGRIFGDLTALLTVLKGLPLTYSKDMQEDKEPVFDAIDSILVCVAAMTGMIKDMQVNKNQMHQAASLGFSTATDLADWLVQHAGIPFRDSHHITGSAVKMAEDKGCDLADLSLEELQTLEPRITKDIFEVLTVEKSVASRKSYGGTSPERVVEAVKQAKKLL